MLFSRCVQRLHMGTNKKMTLLCEICSSRWDHFLANRKSEWRSGTENYIKCGGTENAIGSENSMAYDGETSKW